MEIFMTKDYRFYISEMPIEEIEPFIERIKMYSPVINGESDSKTQKLFYIDAFFEDKNINVEKLVSGFHNVKYINITGYPL